MHCFGFEPKYKEKLHLINFIILPFIKERISLHTSQVAHQELSGRCLSPVSVTKSDQEYFYSPLDGMLVHGRITPSIIFANTRHLTTSVDRGTVRVKCLTQP